MTQDFKCFVGVRGFKHCVAHVAKLVGNHHAHEHFVLNNKDVEPVCSLYLGYSSLLAPTIVRPLSHTDRNVWHAY